jgi:hypothetical protein
MDTPRSAPGRPAPTTPVRDPATVKRFATAFATVDPRAVPPDPLARELHLAVTELDRLGVSEPTNARLAELLAPLYRALAALEGTPIEDASPRALMEFVVRVDGAISLLEAPHLGVVPTDQLGGRFRELYGGIVRLRGASSRLHRAWRSTPSTEVVDR